MTRYRLEIRPSVEKTLRKIRDAQLQQRLDAAFEKLAENPGGQARKKCPASATATASASAIIASSMKFTTRFW
jgi:mRNA-degrading endonuclease RelE of RelBE toxin-antitoxin system